MRFGIDLLLHNAARNVQGKDRQLQVLLNRAERAIDVKYIDGPFRYLDNRWRFEPLPDGGCSVHLFIDYEFKSRILGALMGSMFDRAFRMFTEAFEKRAAAIYSGSVG